MLKTEAGAIAAKRKRGVFPARKNDRIRDEIARRISVGLYTGQMPSVAELAKEFDVNPMTICKALDSLEKSGAIKKSERVGTFVKHKRRIAVLFASKANKEMGSRLHRNLAYMPLIDGIEAAAESKDYTAISYSCDPRDKEFVSALRNKVDGCVLITHESCDFGFFSSFGQFPWVRVMGAPLAGLSGPQISYDNSDIGPGAAGYLKLKGCRDFLYFGHALTRLFEERLKGFRKRSEEFGGKFLHVFADLTSMDENGRFDAARKGFQELPLKEAAAETGIYISADIFAASVYQALYSLGLTPVKDVPIVAGDHNEYFLNGLAPRPPCVDIRMPEIGAKAVETLFDLIGGNSGVGSSETILLKPIIKE